MLLDLRLLLEVPASVTIAGVGATAAVGAPAIHAAASAAASGVNATGSVGAPVVHASANIAVTGVASTSAVGSPIIHAAATVAVSGVAATSAVGSTSASAGARSAPSGVTATGAVGTVEVTISLQPAGVAATGAVGSPTIAAGAIVAATGVEAIAAVGLIASQVTAPSQMALMPLRRRRLPSKKVDAVVRPNGVSAKSRIGVVTVHAQARPFVRAFATTPRAVIGAATVYAEDWDERARCEDDELLELELV